jgi:hypothetical protein
MSDTIYTCPMHPEVQQAGPGPCPKCGMKLEPKAAKRSGACLLLGRLDVARLLSGERRAQPRRNHAPLRPVNAGCRAVSLC